MHARALRTSVVAGLVMFALSRGLTMQEILAATGLEAAQLADPDGWIPLDNAIRVWELMDRRFPDQPLGLEAAALARGSIWGAVNRGFAFAPTVGDAVRIAVRYVGLISSGSRAQILSVDEGMAYQLEVPPRLRAMGHAVDLSLVHFLTSLCPGAERSRILRVDLEHAPRGPIAAYEAAYRVPLRFEQPASRVLIAHADWDAPRPAGDPALLASMRVLLEASLAELGLGREADLAPMHRAITECAARGEYAVPRVARAMNVSLRALHRLARTHDLRIGALLERTREANARRFLADRSLTVEEVAFLLGYSEERAFTRAFKRWTGRTPAQHRSGA